MRKRRVEGCFRIAPPRGALRDGNGTWKFTVGDLYLRRQITAASSTLTLFPNYRMHWEQTIKLHRTEPKFGGVRWWFLCPDCQRCSLYLYLPHDVPKFSCRICHNLSYKSTQSSRSPSERHFQRLGREMGATTREARLWSYLTYSNGPVPETKRPNLNKVRKRRTRLGRVIAELAREKRLSI